ncbi:MAG: MFS transporter, partial [Desulfobacterales bacterium]|nr:MFS transporter [Desulfobacterales bacterium]
MTNPISSKNKWIVFSLVAVGVFMSTLDSSIVNIAMPAVMRDLQAPMNQIEWVVMSYLLTVSSLLLAFGRLSDIKGRPWVYSRGFIIFTAGSLLCAMAPGAIWLIFARAFQGMGAAMIMACSPALVADVFPSSERGRGMGMIGTVVAAGLTTGPALGGVILAYFSWRVIFFINIPIGVMSVIAIHRILGGKNAGGDASPEKTIRGGAFDWPGAFLLAVCFCSFILALNRGGAWGYTSWRFGACVLAAGAGAMWFIRVESRSPHPIFETSLARIRLFALPILSALILFASLFTIVFLMPFYLVHPAGCAYNKAGGMMM